MKRWKRSAQASVNQTDEIGCVDPRHSHALAIRQWLASELGQALSQDEGIELERLIPQVYAPVAVQLANAGVDSPLRHAQSALRIRVEASAGDFTATTTDVASDAADALSEGLRLVANPIALPFAANSVDLIVASHTLDTVADPHQVLREIHQVLQPEGHLIIVGFNPVSLWGVRRLLTAWRGHFPWSAGFIRLSRIKDWLRLLGFDITAGCLSQYGMPVASDRVRRRFQFLEPAGRRWWPGLGGVYILVARKKDLGMTPVGAVPRRRRRLTAGLGSPVARRVMRTNDQDC